MINFKINKILLEFLLAFACAGMNGALAMKSADLPPVGPIDKSFGEQIFKIMDSGDKCGLITLRSSGGVEVGRICYSIAKERFSVDRYIDGSIKFVNGRNNMQITSELVGDFFTDVINQDDIRLMQAGNVSLSAPAPAPASAPAPAPASAAMTEQTKKIKAASESWFACKKTKVLADTEQLTAIQSKDLNKYEFETAVARLAFIELSQYCNGNDLNSTKALLAGILADICRISNDYFAICNHQVVGLPSNKSWLNESTRLFMAADVVNVLAKASKLFSKQDTKKKFNFNLEEAKKDVKVGNILKVVKKLSTIAQQVEGIAAVVRSLEKFGTLENAKIAQYCTLFISLTRIIEYYVETADSKLTILQAVPYLMLATTVLAVLGDWRNEGGIFSN